jgi:TrmH family RNA methyltransferase
MEQGIVAVCPIVSSPLLASPTLVVALDGVQDPGNLGTIIRSSVASGVDVICTIGSSCDPWSPKAIRSATGATFKIPFCSFATFEALQEQLQVSQFLIFIPNFNLILLSPCQSQSLKTYFITWSID